MPKSVRYKASSVVYVEGDVDDRIYILKSGRIMLKSSDIETGEDVQDMIQTGEFFGVKSALGHYPREEDAVALSDAQVVQFSVQEFEQLATNNTRITLKMLKVFSGQLRRIHHKVSMRLNQDDETDSETGLHRSAKFYFAKNQFQRAAYIWQRYLALYPQGRYASEATTQLDRSIQSAGVQRERHPERDGDGTQQVKTALSDAGTRYFEAQTAFANEQFDEAIAIFERVVAADDMEYSLKARYEIGRALFAKERYEEAIRHFSQLAQQVPRLPQMPDLLYMVGTSCGRTGDVARAKAFLAKAQTAAEDQPALRRKIAKAQRELDR